MNRYYLSRNFNRVDSFNAGSKAVRDAEYILEESGYKPLSIAYHYKSRLRKLIVTLFCTLTMMFKVRSGDVIFVQTPIRLSFFDYFIYKFLLAKRVTLQILIHDIPILQEEDPKCADSLLAIYKKSSLIIAHTPNMKRYFVDLGIEPSKIEILYLFDYVTPRTTKMASAYGRDVVFAGSLEKSKFLRAIDNSHDVNYLLYGLPTKSPFEAECITYKGAFESDEISDIEGDWGLVWDGNSVDTCSGALGDYLKINSSHKISLYIACEKPVIIWSESSLKEFIESNNLGVAVSSLSEIGSKIGSLTEQEKESYRTSIKKFSARLRSGEMLSNILTKINS